MKYVEHMIPTLFRSIHNINTMKIKFIFERLIYCVIQAIEFTVFVQVSIKISNVVFEYATAQSSSNSAVIIILCWR